MRKNMPRSFFFFVEEQLLTAHSCFFQVIYVLEWPATLQNSIEPSWRANYFYISNLDVH